MTDIAKMDLYALFDVVETCSTSELTSAFRKKALTCHPDKYPDDEEKKELFLLIKRALELLTDEQARKAYDACRKQKQLQQERLSKMDDRRKKFKETLEQKEQRASQTTCTTGTKTNIDKLRVEVERLRREGNRLVIDELEKLQQTVQKDEQAASLKPVHLIIKYLSGVPIYTDDELRTIFSPYGTISAIVNGHSNCALIEFYDEHVSTYIENEKGLDDRPFASVKIKKRKTPNTSSIPSYRSSKTVTTTTTIDLTKPDFQDFEAMIMKKLSEQGSHT
jgi:hypothetical protein